MEKKTIRLWFKDGTYMDVKKDSADFPLRHVVAIELAVRG